MADNTLIQSGKQLYDQQAAGVGQNSKAFQEGKQMINDQLDKNIKDQRADEKHKLEVKALEQQEQLREMGIEEKIMMKEAQTQERIGLLERAIEQKLIDPVDYPEYQKQGDDWLKDQTTQLKLIGKEGGAVKLEGRIENAIGARENFQNIAGFAASETPGGDSPYAKELDFAIEQMAKDGSQTGFVTEDGVDYVTIPNPGDPKNPYKISAEKFKNAKSLKDLTGEYTESKSFSTALADWKTGNGKVFQRLSTGTGTSADVASIGNWFSANATTPNQQQELLDTFFTSSGITLGSELALNLGLEDKDKDGKLTANDVDPADFAEVFTGAVMAEYEISDDQQGDTIAQDAIDKKLGQGKYAPKKPGDKVAQTSKVIDAGASNFNALVNLPGVFDVQIAGDGTTGVLYLGKDRNEKNAFTIEMKDGVPTQAGLDKLKQKFGYQAATPETSTGGGTTITKNPGESTKDFLARKNAGNATQDNTTTISVGSDNTNTDAPAENTFVSPRHERLSKSLDTIQSSIDKFDELRVDACSNDPEGSLCKSYTERWNSQKKDLEKKQKQIDNEVKDTESSNQARLDKAAKEDAKENQAELDRLLKKQAFLEGEGRTLSETEQAKLKELQG